MTRTIHVDKNRLCALGIVCALALSTTGVALLVPLLGQCDAEAAPTSTTCTAPISIALVSQYDGPGARKLQRSFSYDEVTEDRPEDRFKGPKGRGHKAKTFNRSYVHTALILAGYTESVYGDAVPTPVDHTRHQTPIKNQGACGSCWAHAFTEVVEWHLFRQTGKFATLSTMEVTACTELANGCDGESAIADVVVDYGMSQRPLVPSETYPYDPRLLDHPNTFDNDCLRCTMDTSKWAFLSENGLIGPSARVSGFGVATRECLQEDCTAQNMTELALALNKYGPLMVGVDATQWDDYTGGIFPASACSSNSSAIDHAVVLTGYTETHWIVRNSWSSNWGINGYIFLERNETSNTCGIANQAIWLKVDAVVAGLATNTTTAESAAIPVFAEAEQSVGDW